MKPLSVVLSTFLLLPTLGQKPIAQPGLTVPTQQGVVQGTQVLPTVRQFLGIPFAVAKRWQAPQPPPVRKSVFQATQFGDSCTTDLSPLNLGFLKLIGVQGINTTTSENCMSVNIWAPSLNRKQKTAVMVWIYGGGYVFGTSNTPVYNGQNFVRDNDDLTIVTFNYRLNIFGQPNAPQLGSKNLNFGLLDVDAAVQWVHTNIGNFGGDPDRIVLFGQSAGAQAADAYTFAHPKDTIVKGVIEQSGSISGGSVLTDTAVNHDAWNAVAAAVGCGASPTPQQFSCMQGVQANKLESAVISTGAAFDLVADNVTRFADTQTRAANGNFLHVPLLGGTTANEFDVFIVNKELLAANVTIPAITEVFSDIQTLLIFTCPMGVTALHRFNAKVPTFRYQYQPVFPNISPRPDLRAYHASEIPLVFGTYNASDSKSSDSVPSTSNEIALSRYIQSAWVAFARDPAHGLVNFGWPLYDPKTSSLAQLGNLTNETGVAFTQGSLVDFGCANTTVLVQIQNDLMALLAARP